jgi:hypothetical protein
MVAERGKYEATIVVDQADVQLVAAGQSISVMLESSPWKRFPGRVLDVSQDELRVIPRELSQTTGGPIAVKPAADGQEKPLFTFYEVYGELFQTEDLLEQELGAGYLGRAKIQAGHSTLGGIASRYVRNLINFK